MADIEKIQHSIKSKTASLKEAAEFFNKCPDAKKLERVAVMRDVAQNIDRLLGELEAELKNDGNRKP
ncbi:MAG: hypothetical protein AB1798_08125 [Spirochaetota bacterium]